MATPTVQPAFSAGEVGPALFGRTDISKTHVGLATARNGFVSYRGGFYSRAGTAFSGFSMQTGRAYPPRLVPFQYSINQGYALEFGNYYMRLLYNGAFVTEPAVGVVAATRANPCVITIASLSLLGATPVNSSVSATYAPGDQITVAGGSFSTAAVLSVTATQLSSATVNSAGSTSLADNYLGYTPGDSITLAGGTHSSSAQVVVATTKVIAAAVQTGGTGGANGAQTVTGTTGTGTPFQASVTVSGGAITAVNSITVAGSYTANPTIYTNTYYVGVWPYGHYQTDRYYIEPVTGAGLVGAKLYIQMGVATVNVSLGGVYSKNPIAGAFTQALTSGGGTGATFTGVMGPYGLSVSSAGVYTVAPSNPAAQASTTGTGVGAQFNLSFGAGSGFNTGDWVYLSGLGGMTQLNGRTVALTSLGGNQYSLTDAFGNAINSTSYGAYTSGGLAARIYTLATPWGEQDLAYLKFTQSANVMSICCVNQVSNVEYPPSDLIRLAPASWSLSTLNTTQDIAAPGSCSAAVSGGTGTVYYSYVATAVNPADGSESIASPIAQISGGNMSASAGSVTVTCGVVAGTNEYNWYKATVGYSTYAPAGALFGYAGTSYGTQFTDTNIVADFAQVPPLHQNPFARGQILPPQILTGGSNLATCTASINTVTGSGAVLRCVIVGGALSAIIVVDPGQNYSPNDTISFSVTGGGAVAPTANINVGPGSGTYPGVPFYFQQRRGYAFTINQTDTYWLSQPGSYTNFDFRIPTIDSDAITGTPWAQEVNGIQWAIPMPGGLVVLTGLSAWQVSGGGSSASPGSITPSGQQAIPQAYNGCSATVPPLRIENYILYVQAKGSIYRLLSYSFYTNIYSGADQTIYSPQLFSNYTIVAHTYCEEPYKIIWSVRSDGVLLSDTFLPNQEINGWTRHDTQGLFQSVCTVTEPPVDALYAVVRRTINGQTGYMIERFDNRIEWTTNENCWCVDAGLSLAQPTPAANITASAETGAITGYTNLVGGANYGAATQFIVSDPNGGPGTGATATGTIVGGVITALTVSGGSAYANPIISAYDPSGLGAGFSATLTVNTATTLTASASVFSVGNVGSVVRMNGGKAQITGYTSGTQVSATVLSPFMSGVFPLQASSGAWTMTAPVSTIGGLWHLAGGSVVGTADGNPFGPLTVSAGGTITLAQPASNVIVGLGFTVQAQSVYLQDQGGGVTVQGRRKKVTALTARVELSYGMTMGTNQPDGSVQSPPQIAPTWIAMQAPTYDYTPEPYGVTAQTLYTGDVRLPLQADWETPGQIAVQQSWPLPLNILALVPETDEADEPETRFMQKQKGGGGGIQAR